MSPPIIINVSGIKFHFFQIIPFPIVIQCEISFYFTTLIIGIFNLQSTLTTVPAHNLFCNLLITQSLITSSDYFMKYPVAIFAAADAPFFKRNIAPVDLS